jgi:GNAT superfamily N-acetyltransferase
MASVPSCSVRAARPDDVPTIARLIRGLAAYEHLEHLVEVTERSLHEHLFGAQRYCEVLMGQLGDRPVGFALFFHNYSTFLGKPGLYLEDLFVEPEARGHGVGTALLRSLARIALERGCGRLEWAVLDWNLPSISFYRKLGAVPLDEWTVFRVDGQAMRQLAQGAPEIHTR